MGWAGLGLGFVGFRWVRVGFVHPYLWRVGSGLSDFFVEFSEILVAIPYRIQRHNPLLHPLKDDLSPAPLGRGLLRAVYHHKKRCKVFLLAERPNSAFPQMMGTRKAISVPEASGDYFPGPLVCLRKYVGG